MPADAMQKARDLLTERKRELEEELRQIEKSIASLGGNANRRGARRRRTATNETRASRSRRRGGGTRSEQAVKIITKQPGIGVAELGKQMKLGGPNYLYRVLPDLEKEGKIKKRGKGYHPA